MANPKRKTSKARRNKRRANDGLTTVKTVNCSNCGEAIAHHRVCSTCGFYKGRQIVAVRTVAE